MRLTTLLLFTGALHVSATGFSQQVTLTLHHASLEKALDEIQSQTGYDVVYAKIELQNAHPVDIDVRNASLKDVLNICFKDQPLAYTIEDTYIVVKRKPVSQLQEQPATPPGDIRGRITDMQGQPLVGASVMIKGTKRGTLTANDGSFTLKNLPAGTVLVVSYAGFVAQEVTVGVATIFNLSLTRSNNPLDEVKVIAYGQTTERLSIGNIAEVKAEEIEKQPVDNPLLALEGKVPGLFITQSTGYAGGGVETMIQGQNSLANGNDPFFVIDGVPYASELPPNVLGGVLGTSGINNVRNNGNPLAFINPADIESITVLKDADATAIYGSRAANGAILITTKKGKIGHSRTSLTAQEGMATVPHFVQLLNTQQYLEMRHEAIANDGLTTGPGDYDINGLWDTTRYTNWQKTLLGGTAHYTSINGTVSGGNSNTQYLIDAAYHKETNVFHDDFSDQKGSMHFSINSASDNQKFRVQFTGNYMVDENRLPDADLTNFAFTYAPDAPSLYNKDGSLNWMPDASGGSTWSNPLAGLLQKYNVQTDNLVGNAVLSYALTPGLTIKSNFGYTNLHSKETVIIPLSSSPPELRSLISSTGLYGNNLADSWIIEPQIDYKGNIGKGQLNALIGSTIQQSNNNTQDFTGTGFSSDQQIANSGAAATVYPGYTSVSNYKYAAVFGRMNYNWLGKYLVDVNIRRDGSSRFGSANQFHDFWSVGAGWIFTEQEAVKKAFPVLSFGKFRASYGTTGNDQITDYRYLASYYPTSQGVAYQNASGLQSFGVANPYLQWEETKKLNLGLDIGVLQDKILLNVNYYLNRSSNQLLNQALPSFAGSSVAVNFPATVQNSGLELTLHIENVHTKNFQWRTTINFALPRNKLVSFPGLDSSTYASNYIVGKPITIARVFHYDRVDPATGVFNFFDANGKLTTTPDFNADRTAIVNLAPAFYGGVENSLKYKRAELSFLFQFTKQKGQNYALGNYPGRSNFNQPVTVLNRWTKPGDIATYQRFNSDYSLAAEFGDAQFSNFGYTDASFVRLKNLSLSYEFPANWEKKIRLANFSVYVQGQNLITITHYIGLDPEALSIATLPPLRVLTAGLKVGF